MAGQDRYVYREKSRCGLRQSYDVDKVLIITGGKEPKLIKSGGAIVPPIIRKASYFPLGIITVPAAGDEIRTVTAVPIMVDWTAQIRPNTKDDEALKKAVISFQERGTDGIIQDIQLTLPGAVRDIVASMTPEEVQLFEEFVQAWEQEESVYVG